jgi:Flp pilus assembly protein TadB
MSRVQIAVLAGGLVVAATMLLVRALHPRPASIAALRARYFRTSNEPVPSARATSWTLRVGHSLVGTELGLRLEARAGADLRAADLTVGEVIARAVVAAVVGAPTAAGVVLALLAAALVVPSPAVLVLVPLGAGLGIVSVAADIRNRCRSARQELRQAAADFVQLVAVSLTTSRSVEESVAFAAHAGDGAGYVRIRQAVSSAPQKGVTIWDALDEVGHTYQVAELRDLAASIQRQASVGASVEQTVSTLAASMRAKALDDLERAADRANSNLSGPTIGFVVGMVLLLAYPLAIRVSEAFHP